MKIVVANGKVQLKSMARLAATAYLFGAGTAFVLPVWLAMLAEAIFGTDEGHFAAWVFVAAAPIWFAILVAMMYCFALLGLWLYQRWRPIEIVNL